MDRNLRAAEAIKWAPEEVAFATELQSTLRAKPNLSAVSQVEDYSFGKQGFYSTDVGDVSWVTQRLALVQLLGCLGRRRIAGRLLLLEECPSAIREPGWLLKRLPPQPWSCCCHQN